MLTKTESSRWSQKILDVETLYKLVQRSFEFLLKKIKNAQKIAIIIAIVNLIIRLIQST
jgi:hypothetical protein